jgi:hypothetical protein
MSTPNNDLKRINTPLLLYMITLFDPDALRILSPSEKFKREKTLRFLQQEMESRKIVEDSKDQAVIN